ncbi:MAG: HEPN domain-containing protein [Acidobacteria bacterium]|nr:MAG: HEPN domain-containing protein [Acidobacteriota bacterium]
MNRFRDWFEQASRDLGRAEIDIRYEYWEWACFTAQQAAEKAVKALLMKQGFGIRGHGITSLLKAAEQEQFTVPEQLVEMGQLLDAYYIPTRYPNGFPSGKPGDYYNRRKAEEAVNAAREIVRFCQTHLD